MLQKNTLQDLITGITKKERRSLAKAITLIESMNENDKILADALLSGLTALSKNAIRIGISGSPGVGKSTFIENFGLFLISLGKKVAVLAVDPSSPLTGGSILGDKTRMLNLSNHPDSFIRPSPSGGSLGGVARKTKDAISLCEAFGFDIILVETVGVGQSEVAVCGITDIFLLLLQPGAGDELQGIKKGIMEIADIVIVNKADGKNKVTAEIAKSEVEAALSFSHPKNSFWKTPVQLVSALEKSGLEDLWSRIQDFFEKSGDSILTNREKQNEKWFWVSLEESILEKISDIRNSEESAKILTLLNSKKISFQKALEEAQILLKVKL
ncbi:MAG: methylmalonyl Co-A mutase-associated GTPase MeaB [Leptospiraceae bacterium]|nr:methylmalonyl Co-A mutase-associated GTPase MeaB [Leptospiraceae bacterium]